MIKKIERGVLPLAVLLVIIGCGIKQSDRALVVTEVTHFGISAGAEALSLPIFIGYQDEEKLVRDAYTAESYFDKLSKIYDLKSFSLIENRRVPSLIDVAASSSSPISVYGFAKDSVEIEVAMTTFSLTQVQYRFRMKSGDEPWREHLLNVQVGQTCSVGVLTDNARRTGYLLSLAVRVKQITPAVSASDAVAFLRGEDSVKGEIRTPPLTKEERDCIASAFGKEVLDEFGDEIVEPGSKDLKLDTPPEIVGGVEALGKAIKYPATARQDGFQGIVLVGLKVGQTGTPQDLHVIKGARADLDTAAVEALRTVKFSPARIKGLPVEVEIVVPISFKLK